jgi:protein sidekick
MFAYRSLHELDTIWLKDGIPLESSDPRYSYNDPWNRTLSLLNADPSHTGRYECRARLRSSRGREQQEAIASATVTVLGEISLSKPL